MFTKSLNIRFANFLSKPEDSVNPRYLQNALYVIYLPVIQLGLSSIKKYEIGDPGRCPNFLDFFMRIKQWILSFKSDGRP